MIRILDPGSQTTVQDLGRLGHLCRGIPPAGPVDGPAFLVANRLVGNDDHDAALECTLVGPRFVTEEPCAIAVTGATMPITVNGVDRPAWTAIRLAPGDEVKVGVALEGVRGYIAFSGGIEVPIVLGSRSTYLRGRLGGFGGRALQKGDVVRLFPAPLPGQRGLEPGLWPASPTAFRVVLGPQLERFTKDGVTAFLEGEYEMLPQSDRMGARLRGPRIAHRDGHDLISDGIALGSIQVPGDGQPIVLLVDRQSTGGYPKIATLCSFDVGRFGQVRPGQKVRFEALTLEEAHRSLVEQRAWLSRLGREP